MNLVKEKYDSIKYCVKNFDEYLFDILMEGALAINVIYVIPKYLQDSLNILMKHRKTDLFNESTIERGFDIIQYTRLGIERNILKLTEFV